MALDKWFMLQASSPLPGALGRVEALKNDPAFSLTQPNKVRALFGGFVFANPLHFHAGDGSGYSYLADQILQLDALNPQVAARMTTALARWRGYDQVRRTAMKSELQRILAHPGLSGDVYELAQKSVGE